MKKIFFIVCLLIPSLLYAGIIMKKSGERLEDVSIKSASGDVITYITEEGEEVSLPKSEVSAILHDDGRYEEIKQESAPKQTVINSSEAAESSSATPQYNDYTPAPLEEGAKEYNVWAYGVYAGMGYFSGKKYDGITVEYRVIYKSKKEEPSFVYLGTTPFAYATEKMATNSFVGRGNPALMNLLEPKPLVIPNDKDVKNIEIRLSKQGYKTVVVKPFRDVIVGCGPVLIISLDKIKPLKDGEVEDAPQIVAAASAAAIGTGANTSSSDDENMSLSNKDTSKQESPTVASTSKNDSPSSSTEKTSTKASSPKIVPQICSTEGKIVYDATYKEGMAQAMRRGYSKSQAATIASEFAEQAKQKAIDECYETIVVRDEDFVLGTSSVNEASTISLFATYTLSSSANQIIPQACYDEGKKAYDAAYEEAEAKALRQGYSKSQAKTIASEAGEKVKKATVDEWYNKLVVLGIDYLPAEAKASKEDSKAQKSKAEKEKPEKEKSTKGTKEQASQDIAPMPSIAAITKISNKEYMFNGNSLDKKAYEEFLQNNCPEAWKKYHSGKQTIAAGWTFFATGIALTGMWGLFGVQEWRSFMRTVERYDYYTDSYYTDYEYDGYYYTPDEAVLSAIILGSFGATFTAISVPMLAVGYHKKNNAYKVYNESCAQNGSPISLNFQVNKNGLGVALHF